MRQQPAAIQYYRIGIIHAPTALLHKLRPSTAAQPAVSMVRISNWWWSALIGPCVVSVPAAAQSVDAVVITATRIAEPADRVPADISIISGKELMERGAWNMADA